MNSTSRRLQLNAVRCGVCRGDDFVEYATGRDFEYKTSDDEFRMVECKACSNVYLNPRPVADELPTIYPPSYYSYNYDTQIHPLAVWAKEQMDRAKIKGLFKHLPVSKPVFLDVGCGNGRFLKMLHKLGVPKENLYGVELDQRQIDRLNGEGFKGFYGRIEEVCKKLPAGQFDLIVMLQVLEHVDDPDKVVKSLSALLNHGGVLVVETPNTNSLDVKLFKNRYWGGYHFPRHWNLFNRDTLARLAKNNGLQVKGFEFLPGHSFWIFSLHHFVEERWQNHLLADWLNPFQNVPLLCIFTAFDLVRAGLGFETSNIRLIARRP
ncbi:MAG TPA: class I SAM-dependent methyltransferase [Candidatus Obscuribacterales bacterium]